MNTRAASKAFKSIIIYRHTRFFKINNSDYHNRKHPSSPPTRTHTHTYTDTPTTTTHILFTPPTYTHHCYHHATRHSRTSLDPYTPFKPNQTATLVVYVVCVCMCVCVRARARARARACLCVCVCVCVSMRFVIISTALFLKGCRHCCVFLLCFVRAVRGSPQCPAVPGQDLAPQSALDRHSVPLHPFPLFGRPLRPLPLLRHR